GVVPTTTLRFSPAPRSLSERQALFDLDLAGGDRAGVSVEITPEVGTATPMRRGYREVREHLEHEYSQWRKRCTRFRTSNLQLSRFLDRAVLDLRMLLSKDERGAPYLDAGVPWFSALFGRDSLIPAYGCP